MMFTFQRYKGITMKERHDNAIDFLGAVCVRCGFKDRRALQIDHINGAGGKERKKITQWRIYARVSQHPEDYQILCANCNWIKRDENNENAKGGYRILDRSIN